MRAVLRLGLILAVTAFLPGVALASEPPVAPDQAAPVRAALDPVEQALTTGDMAAAERLALDAYLVFEVLEPSIAAVDPHLVTTLERAYGAMRAGAASGDAGAAWTQLLRVRELLADATGQRALGPRASFFQSFGLLLREGIEALLLCAALAAACARRGDRHLTRSIGQGAAAALVASVVTAVLVEHVLDIAPAGREAIEGATMVLASVVLFYVSYWLLSRISVGRWMAFLRAQVAQADSRWALFGVAFLAVYREGAETILFYQALAGVGQPAPIAGGFVAAAAVLVVVAFAVLRFGMRLPIRPLFAVTGGLLYYLAVVFAGQGIRELQGAGWVAFTPLSGVPEIGWLGFYPTAQTVAAQSVLVGLALMAAGVFLYRSRVAVARPSGAA